MNCINTDDQEETNPFKIACFFNKLFCTVAQKKDKIIHTDTKYQHFHDHRVSQTFFLSHTDTEEIELIIKSLSSKKRTVAASIPTIILKMFKKELKTPLSNLVNLSFECGAFPEILKTPSVTPIYKKDDSLSCNNYRSISVLSSISKIIEKIVHKSLFSFLERNNYLYELKFGF